MSLKKAVRVSDLEGLEGGLLGTLWELGHSTWITGAALGVGSDPGEGLAPRPQKAEVGAQCACTAMRRNTCPNVIQDVWVLCSFSFSN